ncbi:MAG: YoaP domain-containing protein [Lachnospiraceae bacterium]|nr:YoaP domain-containing protein [Lachnospiraceae bacterium]
MNFIKISSENLDTEHICCAISSKKDPQVVAKKNWLKERLAEGLVFLKGDMRGKCFIEYIPAENAWAPLTAKGYMHINCFWVSGSCKGHGYSNDLLNACIIDAKAKGKFGLTVISSPKKMPFLSDPKYLTYKGFQLADTATPYFTLLYLPFSAHAPVPKFREQARIPRTTQKGFVLYYTSACPFTAKYVPVIEQYASDHGIPFQSIHITTCEAAQNAPAAWTNYALFYNGTYLTNEILSVKKFQSICEKTL